MFPNALMLRAVNDDFWRKVLLFMTSTIKGETGDPAERDVLADIRKLDNFGLQHNGVFIYSDLTQRCGKCTRHVNGTPVIPRL